jgi:hypothetical protein
MSVGSKRTTIGRIAAALGCVCGVIGLLAGLTEHIWKLWPVGWFMGGSLLTLLGLFLLLDGAIASQKSRS